MTGAESPESLMDAPVPNGFMHQFGSDCAVNAAANGTDNTTRFTTNFADASDFLPYKLFLLAVLSSWCE
jgi:hypothetical protein